MSIIRAPRPASNYYVLDKRISEDKRLSWAARGLLVYLLGKPDNWRVSIAALIQETAGSGKRTGRDGVYALIRELIDAGYMTRTSARGAAGEFEGADYVVMEEPLTANPDTANPTPLTANPDTGKPFTANPTLVSNDVVVSNEITNKPTSARAEPQPAQPPKPAERPKPRRVEKPQIPEWVPAEEWAAFVEYRKRINAPLTDHAVKVAIAKLDKLRASGEDIAGVLNQTILSGRWTGLFPVRDDARMGNQSGGGQGRPPSRHERLMRIANEIHRRAHWEDTVRDGGVWGGDDGHIIDGCAVEVDSQADL